jgi:phosphosulfolactate phosphohydrolase-like enzyme
MSDLVGVADEGNRCAPLALALDLVRSLSTVVVVLFSCGEEISPERCWDIEAPALTHPGTWQPRIVEMPEHRNHH